MLLSLRDRQVPTHMQLCLEWYWHAVRIAARRIVAVLAAIKLSLPGSRVGLESIVPPSLSCLHEYVTVQVQIQILDHEDTSLHMLTYHNACTFFSVHIVSSPRAELKSTVEGFVLIFPDRSNTLIRECHVLQVWWVSNGIIWISDHVKTDIDPCNWSLWQ